MGPEQSGGPATVRRFAFEPVPKGSIGVAPSIMLRMVPVPSQAIEDRVLRQWRAL